MEENASTERTWNNIFIRFSFDIVAKSCWLINDLGTTSQQRQIILSLEGKLYLYRTMALGQQTDSQWNSESIPWEWFWIVSETLVLNSSFP